MNKRIHKKFTSLAQVALGSVLLLSGLTLSQENNMSPANAYEERVQLGVAYVMSSVSDLNLTYKVQNKPFVAKLDQSPLIGIGGSLPFTNYVGLNGIVGGEIQTINYDIIDADHAATELSNLTTGFTEKDFNGKLKSFNLVIQAGLETGIPLYSSYESQTLLKLIAYAGGITGKTFFDDSKFENATIWGYAYGGGLRFAINKFSITGGVRSSHTYWETNFYPEHRTGSENDDLLHMETDNLFNPYFKIAFALY